MTIAFNDDDDDGLKDCGYVETRGSRGFARIGSGYRDSRLTTVNATPRVLSRDVPDQGLNADRIQSALLYVGPSRRERLIDAAWWAVGVCVLGALVLALLQLPEVWQ